MKFYAQDYQYKHYSEINADIHYGFTWKIYHDEKISSEDLHFIETFNPGIYHNDLECYLWAFDQMLPSGAWLENIRFDNDLRSGTAFVYNG